MSNPKRSKPPVERTRIVRRLLNQTCKAAKKHRDLEQELSDALLDRYGIIPNDVDCDSYIDAADYGACHITLAQLDEEMTERGYPPNTLLSRPFQESEINTPP